MTLFAHGRPPGRPTGTLPRTEVGGHALRRLSRRAVALVGAAALAVPAVGLMAAAPALAAPTIHFDGSPGTAAPPATLGGYTMTPFAADARPLGNNVSTVATPAGGQITFDTPLEHCHIGSCWSTWSNGYTGDIYADFGATALTIALPARTAAFYFYAEPDNFSTFDVTATAQDGTTSGPVAVNGSGGAKYFGFYGTEGATLATITVTAPAAAGGFALGEFGIARYASVATKTVVTSSSSPSVVGQPVTFTATVSKVSSPAAAPNGGTVAFTADGTAITGCGASALSIGATTSTATCTVSDLSLGDHSIVATYSGGGSTTTSAGSPALFGTSTSSAITQTVNKATVTISGTTSTPNPSTYPGSVTYSTTIVPPAGGPAPTGTVTFKAIDANGVETTLGTDTTLTPTGVDDQVTASVSHAGLVPGSYTIAVNYSGDTNYNGRSSKTLIQVVNTASIGLGSSSTPNPSTFGDTVTYSATVTPPAGGAAPTGSVTFTAIDANNVQTVLGTDSTLTPTGVGNQVIASVSHTGLSAGSYTIKVSYSGDTNYASRSSKALTQVVQKADQTIHFPAISGHNFGDAPFTITASATSGLPVSFTSNTPAVCTVSGSTNTATVTIVGAGDCSITASQPGNANFNPANSKTRTFHVTGADLAVNVTASHTSQRGNGPVSYTVTVTNNGPDAASGVTLSDLLPAVQTDPNTGYTTDAIFLSGATSQGNCAFPAANTRLSGQQANCSLGTIASGDSVTITLNLALASRSRAVSNHPYRFTDTAMVSSTTPDQNTANNSDSATVTYRVG